MASLGQLKDDFLLRKFEEEYIAADLYSAHALEAMSSQTDLQGGAEVTSYPHSQRNSGHNVGLAMLLEVFTGVVRSSMIQFAHQ